MYYVKQSERKNASVPVKSRHKNCSGEAESSYKKCLVKAESRHKSTTRKHLHIISLRSGLGFLYQNKIHVSPLVIFSSM